MAGFMTIFDTKDQDEILLEYLQNNEVSNLVTIFNLVVVNTSMRSKKMK